jgi:integrase
VTVKPGSKYVMGQCPLAELVAKHIRIIRDDKVDFPTAANSRVKALRVMLAWAVEADHIKHNFAKEVSLLKVRTDGYHSWTPEEVKQFEVKHPTGTKERLGLALMLYTGGRRSDAVLLGPSHIKDEVITFTPVKTRRTTGKVLQLPLLPQLQTIIAATATGEKTFLTTARGLSFSPSYFGTFFRQACDEAGLPKCTPHGLRKAGAVIAAERGATDEQLKAIFGWSSSAIVAIYTKQARQKKVAGGAMHLIVAG